MRTILSSVAIALVVAGTAAAQQVADSTFAPAVPHPAYPRGRGPVVLVDEAHGNFHTVAGRYRVFADLLRRDGYQVESSRAKFTPASLGRAEILVIANALAATNQNNWAMPIASAFEDSEIVAVHTWVENGGSLLLISDHMPFPGAAAKLAEAFGARWNNGFALAKDPNDRKPFVFRRSDGSLADHPVTNGRSAAERVDSVATFTGSAFQVDEGATPILVLRTGIESLMTQVAWQFPADTPRVDVSGWPQAAVLHVERGRVALVGEAAMFTAQLSGPKRTPTGMNDPIAAQNPKFLLNLMHWLSGIL